MVFPPRMFPSAVTPGLKRSASTTLSSGKEIRLFSAQRVGCPGDVPLDERLLLRDDHFIQGHVGRFKLDVQAGAEVGVDDHTFADDRLVADVRAADVVASRPDIEHRRSSRRYRSWHRAGVRSITTLTPGSDFTGPLVLHRPFEDSVRAGVAGTATRTEQHQVK